MWSDFFALLKSHSTNSFNCAIIHDFRASFFSQRNNAQFLTPTSHLRWWLWWGNATIHQDMMENFFYFRMCHSLQLSIISLRISHRNTMSLFYVRNCRWSRFSWLFARDARGVQKTHDILDRFWIFQFHLVCHEIWFLRKLRKFY